MNVSVVITLKNRAPLLARTLPSMLQWGEKDWELVVVDDSSIDGLKAVLGVYLDRIDINYVKIDNRLAEIPIAYNSPAIGINVGVKCARHEIILKTEPECYWTRNNVAAARACHTVGLLAIGTAFRAPPDKFPPFDDFSALTHVPDGLYYYVACFDRQKFIDIGGVEEEYGRGVAAEDNDFHDRFRRTGHVRHEPSIEVVHLWHPTPTRSDLAALKINKTLWDGHHKDAQRTKANVGRHWGSENVIIQRGL